MHSTTKLWIHDLLRVRLYTSDQGALNPQNTYWCQIIIDIQYTQYIWYQTSFSSVSEPINENTVFHPFGVNDWT